MKLFNTDILDKETLSLIPNDIDIVFTSPPYNLGKNNYFGEWHNTKTTNTGAKYRKDGNNDNRDNWCEWLELIVRTYLEKAEYFFLNLQSLSSNKRDINKLIYKLNDVYCDKIIWNKRMGIPHGKNSRVMTATFEEIFIFSKNPTKRVGTREWKGNVNNLFTMHGNRINKFAKIHAALFPPELPEYIFRNFVKKGGKVCDPFMGLGTSGIAAKKLNMEFIGVEIDKSYFDIAKKRISEKQQVGLFIQ